jgi:hypothetical protein
MGFQKLGITLALNPRCSLKDQLPAFSIGINGSTCVRACDLHRGYAHGRALYHRERVRVRAYYHYGNTFRFTSISLLIEPSYIDLVFNSF